MSNATATIAAILAILSFSLSAAAGVSVEVQDASIYLSARSACEAGSGVDPERQLFNATSPGDLDEHLSVSQASACGDAFADAAFRLEIREGQISGSVAADISLNEGGEAVARSQLILNLLADETTPFRLEVSRSYTETGDEPQMGGAFGAVEYTAPSVEPDGTIIFEGVLEAGVSRRLVASAALERVGLLVDDGRFYPSNGESTGSVDFTIHFGSARTVATEGASMAKIKSLY